MRYKNLCKLTDLLFSHLSMLYLWSRREKLYEATISLFAKSTQLVFSLFHHRIMCLFFTFFQVRWNPMYVLRRYIFICNAIIQFNIAEFNVYQRFSWTANFMLIMKQRDVFIKRPGCESAHMEFVTLRFSSWTYLCFCFVAHKYVTV